ncbi:acetyl/propionyl/methylcrotonyl-CoA carboxylase subunit alpha [Streptomyces sp. NPDC020379]|uniref:acetyl/propionyl/methylcrotonyl-CoA carboxylase subunit alpha n=1 Tax=Streptomyces sp. NPDC020379 TaxID=3365071 RepID=UPI00379852B8
MTIHSVLVANRGEIACRIFRTCRELGITTVAVHSDADASARHVREADASVRLPGSAASGTYLRGDLVVRAALAAGADAVHPGYGFLSESAEFARAVAAAGLVWIGPSPAAIEAMASKTRAKELMAAAGVPLLAALDPAGITEAGLPVLVKAAAGGGGRGMRVVRELGELEGALASARTEALSAFGDAEVFVEPYVEDGRHVEVQVLADAHGCVWTLGTRDCSLQRRHQKVIEEAPAPFLPEESRSALSEAAAEAARAIGYVGAGTVEFLMGRDGRPYFLEMNTRLQVEHPVTECVYGVDLVALQFRVAEGMPLGEPPVANGHAVSARLYAEDPANGWLPQTGVVRCLEVGAGASATAVAPAMGGGLSAAGGMLRVDSGVEDGDSVSAHYDPLLAKVITWAPTRAEAVRRLARELERARVHGLVTNRELLVRALRHPEFVAGQMDTGFFDRYLPELTEPGDGAAVRVAALAAALADAAARRTAEIPPVPRHVGGWRNLPSRPQVKRYRTEPGGEEIEIRYRLGRNGLEAEEFPHVRLLSAHATEVVLETGGIRRAYEVAAYGDRVHVGPHAFFALPRFPEPRTRIAPGSLLAPMPGVVVRLAEGLAVGEAVRAGQPLVWIEAMKMEHRVVSPADGTLAVLHAVPGRQVEVGALLAVVTEEPTP